MMVPPSLHRVFLLSLAAAASVNAQIHPDIRKVLQVVGANPGGLSWADSYSVGDDCYCDFSTFDHGIDTFFVEVPTGDGGTTWMSVIDICELLGPGPGLEEGVTPLYNDVQCGNGPPNNAGDEHTCPGRVDIGPSGCGHVGPRWNFDGIDGVVEGVPSSPSEDDHPDIQAVLQAVVGATPGGLSWADSYSVGDDCYCSFSTFDHGIGTYFVEIVDEDNEGATEWVTVMEICSTLGPGPGLEEGVTPLYNDVQCGNGPPNNAGDEHTCPGRVDIGSQGCGHIGPKWRFSTTDDAPTSAAPVSPTPAPVSSAPATSPPVADIAPETPPFTVVSTTDSQVPSSETADYVCVFQNEWSAVNHPALYPGESAHWSSPVLVAHGQLYTMWENGGLATPGVESVAETGSTTDIRNELSSASDVGSVVVGRTTFNSETQTQIFDAVRMEPNSQYLSTITMIAPSPDWFSGFYMFKTMNKATGNWYREFVLETFPWDAGTEEGERYFGSNPATSPLEPISKFTSDTVPSTGVFLNQDRNDVLPVITWTCTLQQPDPTTAAPVTAAPATEVPVTEAPVTDAPATEAPASSAPVTTSPVSEAPVSTAPVTTAPISVSPISQAPVTETPLTTAPVTIAPIAVSQAPVTESPVTAAPVTAAPISASPVISQPPMSAAPATMAPIVMSEAPITAVPVSGAPVTETPVTDMPGTVAPTTTQPVMLSATPIPTRQRRPKGGMTREDRDEMRDIFDPPIITVQQAEREQQRKDFLDNIFG